MLYAVLAIVAVFAMAFVGRVGAARRRLLIARWPALACGALALLLLYRGAWQAALALAVMAVLAWRFWPHLAPGPGGETRQGEDPNDGAARALLGLAPNPTEQQIRAAYRAKMARAHPDRGGSNAEAARLTAARDRLLRKSR